MKKKFYSETIPCCVTGKTPVDLHHFKSRGSGGSDEKWNLMPLIHRLHVKIETEGREKFLTEYPRAEIWLWANGWERDGFNRWWRPSEKRKEKEVGV